MIRADLCLTMAIGFAAAAAAAAAVGPAPPIYKVATVAFDLREGDSAGSKRSGSLCLPAGRINWRDARPDPADARTVVSVALRQAGFATADADNPFEEGVRTVDRAVRVRVIGLRLAACVPPGGLERLLNRSRAIKGDGLIAVGWRIYARGQDEMVADRITCTPFSYRGDPGTLPAFTLAGLSAASTSFFKALADDHGGASTEDQRCRDRV